MARLAVIFLILFLFTIHHNFLQKSKKHLDFQAKSAQFPSGYLLQQTFVFACARGVTHWLAIGSAIGRSVGSDRFSRERARSVFQQAAGRARPGYSGRRRVPACGGGRAESQSLGDWEFSLQYSDVKVSAWIEKTERTGLLQAAGACLLAGLSAHRPHGPRGLGWADAGAGERHAAGRRLPKLIRLRFWAWADWEERQKLSLRAGGLVLALVLSWAVPFYFSAQWSRFCKTGLILQKVVKGLWWSSVLYAIKLSKRFEMIRCQ